MNPRRRELACVAALAVIFVCFTWRAPTMFFSDDDMLNMYKAWTTPAWKIWKAQALPWMPLSRPLGTAVYRVFYTVFGFHPLPLYIFCWLLLIANVFVAWRFFRALTPSVFVALCALSLTLVHGLFQDLYLSAGTIFDRLCFLFTVLAVTVYARVRREGNGPSAGQIALIGALCLMAMNSKESGAAAPAILFGYECIFVLPGVWRTGRVRQWIRSIAPLYCLLGAIVAAFVFGRVRGTGDLAHPAYQPHPNFGFWLTNVAEYVSIILYRHVRFTEISVALTLIAMLALAAALRNRTMLFGWFYFVIAIAPVAFISARPGYVLYVPYPGLGLYFAALLGLASGRFPHLAVFAGMTACAVWIHAVHWPAAWVVRDSPEWRLTERMRHDYPVLKSGARILFADDYVSANGYDLMFNLRLLYHDPRIEVARLHGPALQQPDRSQPLEFDHVFTTAQDTYVELDRRNVEESIRLNILKDYAPGRHFDTDRADSAGYVVAGLLTSGQGSGGWWTTRSAVLKFDLYPAVSVLTLKFFVPHEVATGKVRKLAAVVDGAIVGTTGLTHEGMNEPQFPVPARSINADGFTILELQVDDPYTKGGQEYGVVLREAGFEYAKQEER